MDVARQCYAKRKKSVGERQIYDFTHMWNLRDKTNEQRGKKVKLYCKVIVIKQYGSGLKTDVD